MKVRVWAFALALAFVSVSLVVAVAPARGAPAAVSTPVAASAPSIPSPQLVTGGSPDLGWQPAAPLVADAPHNTWLGGVGLSPTGTGMVVWQRDAAHSEIYVTRFVPNGGGDGGSDWQVPVRLSNGQQGSYGGSVALDSAGNAIAIWYDWTDAYGFRTMADRYNVGVGWAPPQVIDQSSWYNNAYPSENPQIAMNGAGVAFAVWNVYSGTRYMVWGNRYSPSTGWGNAVILDNSTFYSNHYAYTPKVGVDAAGNALVTWYEWNGTRYRVVDVHYNAGTGVWTSPLQLDTGTSYAVYPSLSVDAAGNAAIAWVQWDSPYHVYASVCQGATCGPPSQLETSANYVNCCRAPSVSENGGTVFVTWDSSDGTDTAVYVNRYAAGAWTGYFALVDWGGTSVASQTPAVVSSSTGNATVVWLQEEPATPNPLYLIQSARYINGSGWQGFWDLDYEQNGGYAPMMAMDASGNALAVWNYQEQLAPTTLVGILGNIYTPASSWMPYWQQQQVEYDQSLSINFLSIETNLAGQGVATWVQNDGPVQNAYASIYSPSTGWGLPTQVEKMELGGTTEIWSGIDNAGNVIAIYRVYDGTVWGVYASRYTPSGGWGAPLRLDTQPGDQFWLRIAVDPAGDALVVWSEYTASTTTYNVYGDHYSVGTNAWSGPVRIQAGTGYASGDGVAMDASGNGFAVWDEENTTTFDYQAYAGRYVAGSGWQTPVLLESHTNEAGSVNIGVGRTGYAAAVWGEYTGSNWQTFASVYTPGTGWSAESAIVGGTTDSGYGTPAVDDAGNVIVPWYVWGTNQFDAYITTHSPSAGWGNPIQLSSLSGDASIPVAAVDPHGDGYVLWRQWNGVDNDVYARRYIAGQGLEAPDKIDVTGQDAGGPLIAVDGAGNGYASWGQYTNGVYVPWVATYLVGNGAPSLSLTAPTATLTNNPSVTVSGTTDPGATVTIDGTPATVSSTGAFSGTFTLPDGTHTFTVVATNLAGRDTTSTATITVDTAAPPLTVTAPANDATLTVPTVLVSGTTEPGASVVVNGYAAAVDSSGSFSLQIPLKVGANSIKVTATDAAGNAATQTLAVAYTNPVPGLENQLNQTNQALNSTQAALQQEINGLRQAYSSTSNSLNGTTASLTDARSTLSTQGTEVLVLLVLVIVSIGIGVMQFVTLRKLRPSAPKEPPT